MFNSRTRLVVCAVMANLIFSTATHGAGLILAQSETSMSDGASAEKPKLVDLWRPGDPGQRINIRGRVTAIDGAPVSDALIYIRQADGNGDYHDERYNTTLISDDKGRYQFATVLPGQYYGLKHIHVGISHDAYRYLDTRILFKGDPNLDESSAPDAVFLEESNVNGETILFGRFDIVLTPQ